MPDNSLRLNFPLLIGDIGGTNARFAYFLPQNNQMHHLPALKTADYSGPDQALSHILPEDINIKTILLAIAAPLYRHITGDETDNTKNKKTPLTNSSWIIDIDQLFAATRAEQIILINDFEAIALALPGLVRTDYRLIGDLAPAQGNKIVVGPGTGLGAAALININGVFLPLATEAGHVDIGPVDDFEFKIWPYLKTNDERFSAEDLISGQGIVILYQAVADYMRETPRFNSPAPITASALANQDKVATTTLAMFINMLARFAGDMALNYLATGGVYLAGGIPYKIMQLINNNQFRHHFNRKFPHDKLMSEIATILITHPLPALKGLAGLARHPENFIIELEQRRWFNNH